MRSILRLMTMFVLAGMLATLPTQAIEATTTLTIANALSDVPEVDIAVNGILAFRGLNSGRSSLPLNLTTGEQRLDITRTGESTPFISDLVVTLDNTAYLLTLGGTTDSPEVTLTDLDSDIQTLLAVTVADRYAIFQEVTVTRTEDGAFVAGNPDAILTIIVFEDYRCSHCLDYQPVLNEFFAEYVASGRVQLEVRTLQTASPDDRVFSLLYCAGEQNPRDFFAMREAIYSITSDAWDEDAALNLLASTFDIAANRLNRCRSTYDQLATDSALAGTIGIYGTPGLAFRQIGSLPEIIMEPVQDFESLSKFIESQLQLY